MNQTKYLAVLCKICSKEEYRNDFLEGRLYMSTYKDIQNFENLKDMTADQQDLIDGAQRFLQTTPEIEWVSQNTDEGFHFIAQERINKLSTPDLYYASRPDLSARDCNMFCLYSLLFNTETQAIVSPDPRIIDTFGDYCTIIKSCDLFRARCFEKAREAYRLNKEPKFDFITYVDDSKPSVQLGEFRKLSKFSYQNEARLVLDIYENAEALKYFEIGSINNRDFTQPVSTTELVYKSSFINGHLYVGDILIS